MKKNNKSSTQRLTEEKIRSLGGCGYAIEVFNQYRGEETNPTIETICQHIGQSEWSKNAHNAVEWLKKVKLLTIDDIMSMIRQQNDMSAGASVFCWLCVVDNWNEKLFKSEILNMIANIKRTDHGLITNENPLGNFIARYGDMPQIKNLIDNACEVSKVQIIISTFQGLLTASEISHTVAEEKALAITKHLEMPDKYVLRRFLENITDIRKYGIDPITVAIRMKMPVFANIIGEGRTFWAVNLRPMLTAEMITDKFLREFAAATSGSCNFVREVIGRNLMSLMMDQRGAHAFVQSLKNLKKHFGEQINLCRVNWSEYKLDRLEWDDNSHAALVKLVVADANIVNTKPIKDEEIIRLINSSHQTENELGEIMLKIASREDCHELRKLRCKIVTESWLLRTSRQANLTADEIYTLRHITPLMWLDIMCRKISPPEDKKETYDKLAQLLMRYRPKNSVIPEKIKPLLNDFVYRNISDPAYTNYFKALLTVGYKFEKISEKTLKIILENYSYRIPLSDAITAMVTVVKKLPMAKGCTFPTRWMDTGDTRCLLLGSFLLATLRERGIRIHDREDFSMMLASLIQKGYAYYWKELLRLPRKMYAKRLLEIICCPEGSLSNETIKRTRKELKILLNTPRIFKNRKTSHMVYAYLVQCKNITEENAKARIGSVPFLLAKYEHTGDVLSWRCLAKEQKINLSDYCEDILSRISNAPKGQKTLLCFEDILQELIDTDSKLVEKLDWTISYCCKTVYSQNKMSEKSKTLFFELAKRQSKIAATGIVYHLDKERYEELREKWRDCCWPEGNPTIIYKDLFARLARL